METTKNAQTQEVEVSSVYLPDYCREVSPEGQEKITRDIQEKGLLQEIVVAEMPDGRKELVAGQRRIKAVMSLGWQKVRARVLPMGISELDKALITTAENEEREDVHPIDKALGYDRVMTIGSLDQQQLADRLRRSKQWVSQYLVLLDLPAAVREKSRRLDFSVGQLREIARLKNEAPQLSLVEECRQKSLTVKELRSRVNKVLALAGTQAQGKEAVQEETTLGCHFLIKGKGIVIKPRCFNLGADTVSDYLAEIQVGLTQFLSKLNEEGARKEGEATNVAA